MNKQELIDELAKYVKRYENVMRTLWMSMAKEGTALMKYL